MKTVSQWKKIAAGMAGALLIMLAFTGVSSAAENEIVVLNVNNVASVQNNPSYSPVFTINEPMIITRIRTYHWNYGRGTPGPGSNGIAGVGSWPAAGHFGMNQTPNAEWIASPNIRLEPGAYTVTCSDQATWSHNAQSNGVGFATVYAIRARTSYGGGSFSPAGKWKTTYGTMTLSVNGTRVSGTYDSDGGEITGIMRGHVFDGYWIENHSAHRCNRPMNGRYYWGRLVMNFDPASGAFSGNWGYCDNAPSTSGWNGTRIGAAPAPPSYPPPSAPAPPSYPPPQARAAQNVSGVWGTSFGDVTLYQQGNRVTGSYPSDNGEITGVMNGNVLEGFWIEDAAAHRCSSPKNGRYYWGGIRWTFNNDSNSFTGGWSYCNDNPGASGWNGSLKRR